MRSLLERSGPIGRLPFLAIGVVLFAIKIGIDLLVARVFGQPYTLLYYVSPLDAPLMSPGGRVGYWLTMWAVALPFIAVGVWLTLRRLDDARLPRWLVALFFVPFANLIFFLAVAAVPSRAPDPAPLASYREPPPGAPPPRGMGAAILMGAATGAVIALGMVGVSVGLLREYGAALFVGAPTISAFFATVVFARLHGPKPLGSFLAAYLALAISFVVMLAFAIEGAVCLIMASPLAVIAAGIGWGVALVMMTVTTKDARPTSSAAMVLLPLWLVAEVVTPMPREDDRVVESTIEIDAPPSVVWHRVLAFEELPPPTELAFRVGVAAPIGATIEGEGVGALRRCRFTTGEFEEPITVWEPGRELSFDVRRQPDPMREMVPWDGPRPPHLDGYFATTRGQFVLEALPGDRTRLHGRTWYALEVFPRAYWSLWADSLVHTIHLRVMRQIAHLSEQDQRAPR
ncbi:MAG: SRPBCC family protein [Myxococcota bacterium]|nr:SRPBCC family protein [Myxococcota bacterium]